MSDSFMPNSRLKVLVVDSDEDSRYLLMEVLVSCRIEPIVFERASDALSWLEHDIPDVLISELRLEDEDGCTFIQKVKAFERSRQVRIPAIALTASAMSIDQMRARVAGFDLHITKPFFIDDLISHINLLTCRRLTFSDNDLESGLKH